ncbi:phage terminase small subunit P27 family [Bosea sp. BH3]|uniref:phage terminase small subunit P27 family n=1 Tax=Bosea sp. BH3 TaxID=2871701 RepID=UPI0021CAE764|nr:phage terminase small subunit P27 family [Bosea sp. BH3]MCU4180673.1 phage terminase small subunit P27 family [Bosea sp. BH3]
MTAGRPPKPSRIRRLEGNRGKRAIPASVESRGRPLMPDHLDDEQRGLWRQIEAGMPPGLLTLANSQAVERMTVAWSRFRECQRKIAALSMFSRGSTGQLAMSPLIRIQNLAAREMHLAGEALGLSPVARARISAPESVDNDPLALLLDGHAYCSAVPRRSRAN